MTEVDKLIAYIKELNFKPNIDDFQHKLIIQKAICLLELMDTNLNYPYSLYVRGPYSPALTKELYNNKEKIEALETKTILEPAEKAKVEKIKEASEDLNPTLLEIMATYAYLTNRLGEDRQEAVLRLKKLKPFFSEGQIAVGVSRSKILFPPSQSEVDDMKKEFAAWEELPMT